MKQKKGFTLIEMIIVIVVLGILAALVTPNFLGTVKNAQGANATVVNGYFKRGLEAAIASAPNGDYKITGKDGTAYTITFSASTNDTSGYGYVINTLKTGTNSPSNITSNDSCKDLLSAFGGLNPSDISTTTTTTTTNWTVAYDTTGNQSPTCKFTHNPSGKVITFTPSTNVVSLT